MVGFDPTSTETNLTALDHTIAGASSGFVTRGLFQPLDVIKIRFQLQIEPIAKRNETSKYQGIFQAFYRVCREEGVSSLWKGHVPAQGLSILYGIVQFSSFEFYTNLVWKASPQSWKTNKRPVVHLLCGGLSGCTSTIVVYPLDLLRTRLVSQGEPKLYKSLVHATRSIFVKEGISGFYKGLTPTLIQIAPYAGAQFGFYRLVQQLIEFINDGKRNGVLLDIASGAAAGICAKTITYPLDVVKKRLQVQGFEEARKPFGATRHYPDMLQCLRTIVREETMLGLFKGLSPSIFKAGLATSCHFTVYEQMCLLLQRYSN